MQEIYIVGCNFHWPVDVMAGHQVVKEEDFFAILNKTDACKYLVQIFIRACFIEKLNKSLN